MMILIEPDELQNSCQQSSTTQFDIYVLYVWKGVEVKTASVKPRARGMNEWRIEI